MCTLFWIVNHAKYKFVFAGNRDEFLGRPTAAAHVWTTPTEDDHKVLAGLDLEPPVSEHSGTWLGLTTAGRFAALTNFREAKFEGASSRGLLVKQFLQQDSLGVTPYLQKCQAKDPEHYGGYSLLCFDLIKGEMACFSNRDPENKIHNLEPGTVYGLSNSVLHDPWNKVVKGKREFEEVLDDATDDQDAFIDRLFAFLGACPSCKPTDGTDDLLEVLNNVKETRFVPKFSHRHFGHGNDYATRTSTVILVDKDDRATFVERDWYAIDDDGRFTFSDKPATRQFSMHLGHSDNVQKL
ncbi:NRDE protein-domain-containing protein [Gongronella butleri]|nr:NRDE protein-domain-containing protein [Gongronella butleri]